MYMYRFLEKYPTSYTPLLLGLPDTLMMYLCLLLLMILGFPPPEWLWWALLVVPMAGAILQFGSRRVMHIRAYYLLVFGLLLVACALVAWAALGYDQSDAFQRLAAWGIVVPLILAAVASYVRDQHRPSLKRMPCGQYGKLDPRAGLIVDPFYTERSQETETRVQTITKWTFRLIPLTAGLMLALMRGMSESGEILLLGTVYVIAAAMIATGVGDAFSNLVATARWERAHGKRIHVARNYRVPSSSK